MIFEAPHCKTHLMLHFFLLHEAENASLRRWWRHILLRRRRRSGRSVKLTHCGRWYGLSGLRSSIDGILELGGCSRYANWLCVFDWNHWGYILLGRACNILLAEEATKDRVPLGWPWCSLAGRSYCSRQGLTGGCTSSWLNCSGWSDLSSTSSIDTLSGYDRFGNDAAR